AQVPPTAYAVYDVQPGEASGTSTLKVSNDSLENQYYRVRLNGDGDVASIFDKTIGKELLSAPARLAISYDNPQQWPAWNMDWDISTIERPTAEPKKFEVPSHQWIDLTDISGEFGATVLTDCKNGSDKPNDHTIRLTLVRTPGTAGGYHDQGTQDLGHHEFV